MTDTLTAALDYADRGWCPVPLKPGTKELALKGVTGYNGTDLDDAGLRRAFAKGAPIALRMPAGVLGLDVDQYGAKHGAEHLAELARSLGVTLPPTWSSTARGPETPSRISFYRVPPGTYASQACEAVEVIQRSHRYAVVSPTIHPRTGTRYEWYGPDGELAEAPPYVDELPELPTALAAHLIRTDKLGCRPEFTDAELDEWCQKYTGREDWAADRWLRATIGDGIDPAGSSHDQTLRLACQIARDVVSGLYDARRGLQAGTEAFERLREARRRMGGRVPPMGEWWSAVRWGAAQAEQDVAHRKAQRDEAEGREPTPPTPPAAPEGPRGPDAPSPSTPEPEEPEDDPRLAPELRDDTMAEAFASWLGHRAIHVPGIGWLTWDGRRYVRDEEGTEVARLAIEYVRLVVERYDDRARALADQGASDSILKEARQEVAKARSYTGTGKRSNLVTDAQRFVRNVGPDQLDAHRHLLNVANGTVDLRTGELSPHNPDQLHTKLADADYRPGFTTPDWDKALAALDDDHRAYLQTAMGATAMGRASEDVVMVVTGDGGNGKTTLLGSCHHALGDYSVSLGANVIMGEGHRPQELMPLRGARFALVSETAADHYLNAERVKALSGGDPITDRYLYARSSLTWAPTHILWVQTNYRPRIKDQDNGIWRRLRPVPFRTSYVGDPDKGLKDRLRDDADNRAAVLTWIVNGAVAYHAEGLQTPGSVAGEVMRWREEESVAFQFMRECGYRFTGSLDDCVPANDVRTAYVTWCERNGYRVANAATFGRMLADQARVMGAPYERRQRKIQGAKPYYYFGIGKGDISQITENPGPRISTDVTADDPW